jgi:hypothetical protein
MSVRDLYRPELIASPPYATVFQDGELVGAFGCPTHAPDVLADFLCCRCGVFRSEIEAVGDGIRHAIAAVSGVCAVCSSKDPRLSDGAASICLTDIDKDGRLVMRTFR